MRKMHSGLGWGCGLRSARALAGGNRGAGGGAQARAAGFMACLVMVTMMVMVAVTGSGEPAGERASGVSDGMAAGRSAPRAVPGAVALRAEWPERHRVEVEGRAFEVESEAGLRALAKWVRACLERQAEARRDFIAERKRLEAGTDRARATPAQLRSLLSEPPVAVSGRQRRGLQELERLALEAIAHPERRAENRRWLMEVAAALRNNHRPPAPSRLEIGQPPLTFLDYNYNPVARGETRAANIPEASGGDSSRLDPSGSSFWQRPSEIPAMDLYHGFGRTAGPSLGDVVWRYAAPKTSYGGCPGFDLTDGHQVLKVKLAETRSEPFAARIFWALGYHVDPTDHVDGLRVQYDRRLLREFHLRKPVQTRICAFWLLPVHTIDLQKRHDPFAFIARAVLRDGTEWTGAELRSKLFRDAGRAHPEDDPENFRADVEARLEHLVLAPANIQYREEEGRSLGPWEFGGLGHENLRELRGVGLLGAWMGWFDSRFENTRLRIEAGGAERLGGVAGGARYRHYFTDLGGGLGRAVGPLSRCSESPNQFDWTFTLPRVVQGAGRMTIPFRIVGYQPIEDTPAFEQMTWDDARWMARWMGRLSEEQVVAALMASGFDAAHVVLFAEKLASRRDQMIEDLGLAGEVPRWRNRGAPRRLDYDPRRDGAVVVSLPDGRRVAALPGTSRLRSGRIEETGLTAH